MDYKTPKDLADYLIYLSDNKTAYNQYFKWKKYTQVYLRTIRNHDLCKICIKLHLDSVYGIEYKSINITRLYSPIYNCVKVNGKKKISPYV